MEHDFHVYDMDSPTLMKSSAKQGGLSELHLSAILKNYETLIKLWGWAQNNVSDADMKARLIGVQTKM